MNERLAVRRSGGRWARWTFLAVGCLGGVGEGWARAGTCRVTSDRADMSRATVTAGATTFDLRLRDVAVTVEINGAEPTVGRTSIKAPLQFEALTSVNELAFRPKGVIDLSDGRVHLGKDNEPVWAGTAGQDGARLSLQRLGVAVSPRPVVPCDRLGLGHGERVQARQVFTGKEKDAVGIAADGALLYAAPVQSDSIRITYTGPFRVRRKYQSWILIESQWTDGTRIKGWTPEVQTHPAPADFDQKVEGTAGEPTCGRSDAPALMRVALRKGAAIAASAGGPTWARVSTSVLADAFADPGADADGWIRLASLPGVVAPPCTDLDHAWILKRDTDTPKSRAPSPTAP